MREIKWKLKVLLKSFQGFKPKYSYWGRCDLYSTPISCKSEKLKTGLCRHQYWNVVNKLSDIPEWYPKGALIQRWFEK